MKLVNAHPDTLEPAGQWVKRGACKDDPDAMFPGSSDAEIDDAKAVCGNCPVIQQCRQWALETREPFGVWGGMSEAERRGLLRQAARRNLTPEAVKAQQTRRPAKPRTLRGIFDDNTVRLPGGHLAWTGKKQINFRGQLFTPKQLCFTLDRGHNPHGRVTSECGNHECVLPAHLVDTEERTRCGTRSGYQKHLKYGEPIDDACRQANTDADNRLRRTGSTKASA